MSLLITRRPEKQIGSQFSRWTALHNPYLFEFTRKDFTIINTVPNFSGTKPGVNTTATPADLVAFIDIGDLIYINSGNYNGTYEVAGLSGSYIILDTASIGVGGSGYGNYSILVNYKLYVIIYNGLDNSVIDILYPKPDSTGLSVVDVSGAIKSVLETEDTCTFLYNNEPNNKISGSFYIGYGFSYKFGSTQITTTEVVDATDYFWLSAAMQVDGKTVLGMNGKGQNMGVYVPLNQSGSAAKFLTMFDKPTKFSGYPFSIGFIYDKDFETTYLERHQQNYNINRVVTSAESDVTLSLTGLFYMNDLQLEDEDPTTTTMDVWLETGGTISGGGYVEEGGVLIGSTDQFANPYLTTIGG